MNTPSCPDNCSRRLFLKTVAQWAGAGFLVGAVDGHLNTVAVKDTAICVGLTSDDQRTREQALQMNEEATGRHEINMGISAVRGAAIASIACCAMKLVQRGFDE